MRLAELSAAERRYLSSPLPAAEALSPLLVAHLSRVLGARMKQRIQVHATAAAPGFASQHLADPAAPEIRWDHALEGMWLRGRLGGRNCLSGTRCAALSHNLLRTLQGGLAETWISVRGPKTLPVLLSLRVAMATDKIPGQHAVLTIYFPSSLASMNQWAQHIIRHENQLPSSL